MTQGASTIGEAVRHDLRVGGGFDIWLQSPTTERLRPVVPVNLSGTGVCFVTEEPLDVGCRCQVRVRLIGPLGATFNHWDLTVAILRAIDHSTGRWIVGGAFEDINPAAAVELAQFTGELAGSIADFLVEFPLFSAFHPAELLELAQSVSPVYLDKGGILFYEGNEEPQRSGLYIIRRGSLKIFKGRTAANPDRTLAVLTPGEVFGEMSLIEPGPHSGSVVALVRAEMLLINRLGLEVLRSRRPSIALKLIELIARVLVRRLSRTTRKLFSPMRL